MTKSPGQTYKAWLAQDLGISESQVNIHTADVAGEV